MSNKEEHSNLLNESGWCFLTHFSENYPLLAIDRIKKNSTSITIDFSGIKDSNELGKQDVDYVINLLKDTILNKIDSENNLKNRIIRNSYNQLILNNNTNNTNNNIDINEEEIKNIILNNNSLNQKHNKILNNISFSIEQTKNKGEDLRGKMSDYYSSIFNVKIKNKDFENINSDIINQLEEKETIVEKAKIIAKEIEKIKNNLNLDENKFWEYFSLFRKGFYTEYNYKFEKYKSLIDIFDIILPVIGNLDFGKMQEYIDKSNKIIETNRANLVDNLLGKNYKGELTKDAFIEKCNGKKGRLFFFDIKGMGILNMKNNEKEIVNFLNSDEEYSDTECEDKLMQGGLNVTNNLLELKDELKSIKEGSLATLEGGDEIYLFIEGEDLDINYLKQQFSDIFKRYNKKARSSYINIGDENNNKESLEEIYHKLDEYTKINKQIEDNEELGYKDLEGNIINSCLLNKRKINQILEKKKESIVSFSYLWDINTELKKTRKMVFYTLEGDYMNVI